MARLVVQELSASAPGTVRAVLEVSGLAPGREQLVGTLFQAMQQDLADGKLDVIEILGLIVMLRSAFAA